MTSFLSSVLGFVRDRTSIMANEDALSKQRQLFESCSFVIIRSAELSAKDAVKVGQ